jgi:hypothetical protein
MAINICDLPLITDVRYWMNSRRLLLAESISPFDPKATSRSRKLSRLVDVSFHNGKV